MSFEHGSLSFRPFWMPRQMPEDAVERFAAHTPPPLDSVRDDLMRGWVSGRHLLDTNLSEDTAYYGGYLRLTLQMAQRKVPRSLLQAEATMEEMAVLAAQDKRFLNQKERSDIKSSVEERLLPSMPPRLKGISFVHAPTDRYLYAEAVSPKDADLFLASMQSALGFVPLPLTPDTAAFEACGVDVTEWRPVSFSPKVGDEGMAVQAGRDFLTWLWSAAERGNGDIELEDGTRVGILLQGPLTLAHEGHGAHETVLRKGEPINSAEAKTCLMTGKKLRRAKLALACDEMVWITTVDADEFTFRSMKIPRIEEKMDSVSQFEERMRRLERFMQIFLRLFGMFTELRADSARWPAELKTVRNWVANRTARA